MRLASLCLEYAPENRDFSRLADALGLHGVVPLPQGHDDTLTAVVLSEDAVQSGWVETWARGYLGRDPGGKAQVIPISFGPPKEIIQGQRGLRDRWLDAYGDVSVEYIDLNARPEDTDMISFAAERLSRRVYERINTRGAHEIAICLDQRGQGRRVDLPVVPDSIRRLDAPVLVFRPDRRQRSEHEVVRADEWERLARTVRRALGEAMGPRGGGPAHVHLFGDAQLGWPYLLGRIFNRTCGRILYCHNRQPPAIFRCDWERLVLPQSDASSVAWEGGSPPQRARRIALLLGKGKFLQTVRDFLKKSGRGRPLPLAHLPHDPGLDEQAVYQLIADTLAFLDECGAQRGTQEVLLFCDLPFAVMPLLSGHLVNVLDGHIHYFEYRKDLQDVRLRPPADAWYEELRMPVNP